MTSWEGNHAQVSNFLGRFARARLSGCTAQADVEADEAAVRSVLDEATAALNPGSGDVVDLDTEDAVIMYANAPAAIGKETIRARQQKFFDQNAFEETRAGLTVKPNTLSNQEG